VRRKRTVLGLSCLSAVLVFAFLRRPVLLHVLSETGCACGEYHPEVTGVIVLNPLRDRAPEQSAATFLEDLRNGKCNVNDSLCAYALKNHRVSDWRLKSRLDDLHRVQLYYTLTQYGVTEPEHGLTGEGSIEVTQNEGSWAVTNYSSYF
jgi:hypothetical protein